MIGIVIPFYKNEKALNTTLECIRNQKLDTETYIRDNSIDNVLFTKAINEGIRHFRDKDKKYILMLNHDCFLENNCLAEMFSFMENNINCGICCPITKDEDGRISFAGAKTSYPFGEHIHKSKNKSVPYKTHWINGACMLLRVEMLHEIGLLDENMKFICSDSDISFTARSRGWDLYVVPKSFAIHSLNGSISDEDEYLSDVKKSDIRYFNKKWASSDLFKELDYKFNKKL